MASPVTSATERIGVEMMTAVHNPCRSVSKKTPSSSMLHRHPEDFLIGLDDLVPNRDRGFNRQFRLCERLHECVRVHAAGHAAHGRFFPGAEINRVQAQVSFVAGTPKAEVEQFMQRLEASLRETAASFTEEENQEKAIAAGFDGYAMKTNKENILRAVESFLVEE